MRHVENLSSTTYGFTGPAPRRPLQRRIRILLQPVTITLFVLAACSTAGDAGDASTTDDASTAGEAAARALPPGAEAMSLLGEPLVPPAPGTNVETLQANLAAAQAAYDRSAEDADSIIWLGRRHAYLAHYREAIDVFTRGIALHPDDARFYRHRGHRYITVRELDNAIADLTKASELIRGQPDVIEPDGAPNAYNIPTSTLHSNIWYHLALAHYLKGDFEAALPAWLEGMQVSTNNDMKVATSDWLYMTYRRLGRDAEAAAVLEPIEADMEILENTAYHRRLLMYKGEVSPDSLLAVDTADPVQLATYGYGVGNWYFYNGDTDRAAVIFRRILEQPNWAAFGFIAAEAEFAHGTVPRLP